jgi:NAD-dependent dihydropyrimidine dehydrogenase PreA subunit
VIIEPGKCEGNRGCKACVAACPYGAVYFNDSMDLAQKCTGCAHLLDNGFKLPRCVESCPTDAIRFGEEEELKDLIAGAAVLKPESGCGPSVYYRNMPGRFIAGTVYDPAEKEVIIGARCRLISEGNLVETFTDAYGDFWFKDLAAGTYSVRIDARGFKGRCFSDLDTARDINMGDIPLARET